jgi:hypothetical protein
VAVLAVHYTGAPQAKVTLPNIKQDNEMRIKPGFALRRVCGKDTVMAQGTAASSFGRMLQLSEAAA